MKIKLYAVQLFFFTSVQAFPKTMKVFKILCEISQVPL